VEGSLASEINEFARSFASPKNNSQHNARYLGHGNKTQALKGDIGMFQPFPVKISVVLRESTFCACNLEMDPQRAKSRRAADFTTSVA
jgi:hypothetical protein